MTAATPPPPLQPPPTPTHPPTPTQPLAQANFHTTLSGDAMVSLIYHKKLNEEWKQVRGAGWSRRRAAGWGCAARARSGVCWHIAPRTLTTAEAAGC